jgi:MFS family permease
VVPIILAAILDVIIPCVMKKAVCGDHVALLTASFLGGVVVGEFGLLATWAVLGPWRRYTQWFATLLVWVALFTALALGVALARDLPRDPNDLLRVPVAYWPAFVSLQVPLAFVRLFRGWRLVLRGRDTARTAIESRQLEVRDFLIVTTILALFLGAMDLVAKRGHGPGEPPFLIIVLGMCGAAAVVGALTLPSCLWVCFRASRIKVRVLALIGFLLTSGTVLVGIVNAVSRRAVALEAPGVVLTLLLGLFATLLSGLGLARACGYVLVSVRTARRGLAPLDGGKVGDGL